MDVNYMYTQLSVKSGLPDELWIGAQSLLCALIHLIRQKNYLYVSQSPPASLSTPLHQKF